MPGLNQKQTDGMFPGATVGWAEADPLRRATRPGSVGRYSVVPSGQRHAPGSLGDALRDLALAEQRLFDALRENESLKSNNEHLMQALDEASRRAVAAQRVAHHDRLTGLPNRLLLIKRLQLAIKSAAQRHRQLALLFIDLDGFKIVNDRYGHTVADRLLSAVGARITAGVRVEDIACRYGGDEFIALLWNLDDAAIAGNIAAKIRKHIGESYSIDGMEIHVGASIGLAVYPDDGESYDALLRHADAAMFRDKATHRAISTLCEIRGGSSVGNQERLTTSRGGG
ncbi:MAG: GGDEF domain-containing protein [Steroidobacteraceae bacterium]